MNATPNVDIQRRHKQDASIWLDSEISARNADRFHNWVTEELRSVTNDLIINLNWVEYVNASGLASMLRVSRIASYRGVRIIWRNMDKNIANLIRLAGLDKIMVVE